MIKEVDLKTGEIATGDKDTIIKTSGIGSCLFICLYDKKNKIGGAVHAMLPTRRKSTQTNLPFTKNDVCDGKYVDESIVKLVEKIKIIGGDKSELKAKIVGGSSMFSAFDSSHIGKENLKTARKILEILNIPVKSESVGGHIGRNSSFNIGNGVVEIILKM